MYAGHLVEQGPSEAITANPRHPYTQLLIEACARPEKKITGAAARRAADIPLWTAESRGCPFAARCPRVTDICRETMPAPTPVGDGHMARCHHPLIRITRHERTPGDQRAISCASLRAAPSPPTRSATKPPALNSPCWRSGTAASSRPCSCVTQPATEASVRGDVRRVPEAVDNWQGQLYQSVEFGAFAGRWPVSILEASSASGERLASSRSRSSRRLYADALPHSPAGLASAASGPTEPYLSADRAIPFVGNKRNARVDVHGGWYDAVGRCVEISEPSQLRQLHEPAADAARRVGAGQGGDLPAYRARAARPPSVPRRWRGADFLVRMCDPAGMFYMTVFDRWSGDTAQREITLLLHPGRPQARHLGSRLPAGRRHGDRRAGSRLATQARMASSARPSISSTAERAFAHLEVHNREYLDDGEENIIDDYCALLAATELSAFDARHARVSREGRRARGQPARPDEQRARP